MKRLFPIVFSCLLAVHSFAGSATWKLGPVDGVWENPANWEEGTFPDGPDDIATFGVSNQTAINVSVYQTEVGELIFNPGASAFTITNDAFWYISGAGITNNSGITQTFGGNDLLLSNSAAAGIMTFFHVTRYHSVFFEDTTSADHGTFVVEGGDVRFGNGGSITFFESSTAANGSFTINAGSVSQAVRGIVGFLGGTAGNGVFVANGATTELTEGGWIFFGSEENKNGDPGNATLIANPGTNGGLGGRIRFYYTTSAPLYSTARVELYGNGTLDMYYGVGYERTVGSIEGDGLVTLGSNVLITGSNNLSTTFSGVIGVFNADPLVDSGSLKKIGTGTLTLTGANIYNGGTTIERGKLVINNREGSGTGSGPVHVNGGRLGGRGIIAGAVVIGTGTGIEAILSPGEHQGRQSSLTIQSTVTFYADGVYECGLDTKRAVADKLVANGVTINDARFALRDARGFLLNPGTALTVIDNTSAGLISGTFTNLADGSIISAGSNTFQANYEGGDGNDLTLTVVQ